MNEKMKEKISTWFASWENNKDEKLPQWDVLFRGEKLQVVPNPFVVGEAAVSLRQVRVRGRRAKFRECIM